MLIIGVRDAIVVIIPIGIVADAVAVIVLPFLRVFREEQRSIGAVSVMTVAQMFFVLIRRTVIVIVRILHVTDTVAFAVLPHRLIVRERIEIIQHPVTVYVLVCLIPNTVPIGIQNLPGIQREYVNVVGYVVAVVVIVFIIAHSVPIGIQPLNGIKGEIVYGIGISVVVVVRVHPIR